MLGTASCKQPTAWADVLTPEETQTPGTAVLYFAQACLPRTKVVFYDARAGMRQAKFYVQGCPTAGGNLAMPVSLTLGDGAEWFCQRWILGYGS
jgi:hypothetical protein